MPPSAATSLVPATERQINIWIAEGETGLERVLKIGETYLFNFRVGKPVSGSLTSGEVAAVTREIFRPAIADRLAGRCSRRELAAGTPDTDVSVATDRRRIDLERRFKIVIPEEGDSATPQLRNQAAPSRSHNRGRNHVARGRRVS